ncbi:MAG: hypothetical protein J0I42_14830 [Bosea sp.]|uniref:hypothetical protein n=1 Tax=Bosea sp. (in: a-proteobacteria) TaxID=1871050 RepID=UPI001ACE6D63|nr:hypothetical protein [Bosea sp. (in: a-proteobacteria)]MBN9453220.1 hypothetical protein [Bosea sp. (in: a-proteobacteria)]
MSPHAKAACDRVIAMMGRLLLLDPAVDISDAAACKERWRQERVAHIAIQEFGGEAKAYAQTELHQFAGGAGRNFSPHAISVSMTEHRDGVRVSGNPTGGRDAA